MSQEASQQQATEHTLRLPGQGRRVSIIGVPLGFGAGTAGVDLGPAALRVAKLSSRISQLGYEVRDLGDLYVVRPTKIAPTHECSKYLHVISSTLEDLAAVVRCISCN